MDFEALDEDFTPTDVKGPQVQMDPSRFLVSMWGWPPIPTHTSYLLPRPKILPNFQSEICNFHQKMAPEPNQTRYLKAVWPDFWGCVFEVWPAPGARESLLKCGGASPPTF